MSFHIANKHTALQCRAHDKALCCAQIEAFLISMEAFNDE